MTFEADEELVTDIPIFAGRDWAVTERSTLIIRAVTEFVVAVIGAVFVLSVAWIRS